MIVAIEGIDASGKATQAKILAERLHGEVISFPDYTTPSGNAILRLLKEEWSAWPSRLRLESNPEHEAKIETVLTDLRNEKIDNEQLSERLHAIGKERAVQILGNTNALVLQSLMTTNRLELLPKIGMLRQRGTNIVFDRYWASGVVYGGLDGLDPKWIKMIQAPMPEPDLWLLIDVTPEESIRRRPERRDRYEKEPGFMNAVRGRYLQLFTHMMGERLPWRIVDGYGTIDEVAARVWSMMPPPFSPSSTFTF